MKYQDFEKEYLEMLELLLEGEFQLVYKYYEFKLNHFNYLINQGKINLIDVHKIENNLTYLKRELYRLKSPFLFPNISFKNPQ